MKNRDKKKSYVVPLFIADTSYINYVFVKDCVIWDSLSLLTLIETFLFCLYTGVRHLLSIQHVDAYFVATLAQYIFVSVQRCHADFPERIHVLQYLETHRSEIWNWWLTVVNALWLNKLINFDRRDVWIDAILLYCHAWNLKKFVWRRERISTTFFTSRRWQVVTIAFVEILDDIV